MTDAFETATTETDPLDPDSDDDGFNDGIEFGAGSDPNDANSTPSGATPVPSLSPGALGLLAFLILALGQTRLRKRVRSHARD